MGAEIPFVFNNYANYSSEVTAEEKTLSKSLGEYLMSFAKTGTPVSETAGVAWPQLDSARSNLVMDVGTTQKPNMTLEAATTLCEFWDSIGYVHAMAPTKTVYV